MPGGGATGAPLASVALTEEAVAGVPLPGVRSGSWFGEISYLLWDSACPDGSSGVREDLSISDNRSVKRSSCAP